MRTILDLSSPQPRGVFGTGSERVYIMANNIDQHHQIRNALNEASGRLLEAVRYLHE